MKILVSYIVISSLLLSGCKEDGETVVPATTEVAVQTNSVDAMDGADAAMAGEAMASDAMADGAMANTSSPPLAPAQSLPPEDDNKGLSTGEKVGVALVVAAVACFFFCSSTSSAPDRSTSSEDTLDSSDSDLSTFDYPRPQAEPQRDPPATPAQTGGLYGNCHGGAAYGCN